MNKDLKLVVGASTGGHMNELINLLHAAGDRWPVRPVAYVTTMNIGRGALPDASLPVHVVGEADRRKPWRSLMVLGRTALVAWRLRPDVVVTTGSMPLALFAIWAKCLGAKIVWIDSVAQVGEMSLSGRLTRRFADLTLVQWPDVAKKYSGTEYAGELF